MQNSVEGEPGRSEKRCSRCGHVLPMTAFAFSKRAHDGHQNYCRACSSAWARENRPRKLAERPEVGEGQKWCRRCENVKSLDEFPVHRKMPDGRQTYCKECFAQIYRARRAEKGLVSRPSRVPEGHKFCRGCETVKPLTMFGAGSHSFQCQDCMRRRDRERHLATTYGLTIEAVDSMLAAQGGLCAICRSAVAAHVDHDHATGKVRGMLCFRCNAALGQFDERPTFLRRAALYLEGESEDRSRLEVSWAERLAEVEFGTAS